MVRCVPVGRTVCWCWRCGANPIPSPPSYVCLYRKLAKDEDITVKIIAGGITNRLYRLMWQDLVRTNSLTLCMHGLVSAYGC